MTLLCVENELAMCGKWTPGAIIDFNVYMKYGVSQLFVNANHGLMMT